MGSKPSSHRHLMDESITSVATWRTALANFMAEDFTFAEPGSTSSAVSHTHPAASHAPPLMPRVIFGVITEYLYPSLDDMLSHESWVVKRCLSAIPGRVAVVVPHPTNVKQKPETFTYTYGYDRDPYCAEDWSPLIPSNPNISYLQTTSIMNVDEDFTANTTAMTVVDFKSQFNARVCERIPKAEDALRVLAIMYELIAATAWAAVDRPSAAPKLSAIVWSNPPENQNDTSGTADESGLELTIAVRSREEENRYGVPSVTPSGRANDSRFRMEFWLSWKQRGFTRDKKPIPESERAVPPPPIHLLFIDHVIES